MSGVSLPATKSVGCTARVRLPGRVVRPRSVAVHEAKVATSPSHQPAHRHLPLRRAHVLPRVRQLAAHRCGDEATGAVRRCGQAWMSTYGHLGNASGDQRAAPTRQRVLNHADWCNHFVGAAFGFARSFRFAASASAFCCGSGGLALSSPYLRTTTFTR